MHVRRAGRERTSEGEGAGGVEADGLALLERLLEGRHGGVLALVVHAAGVVGSGLAE